MGQDRADDERFDCLSREERRHWHTEEFGRVVDEIIAKGNKPKAYATYNPREIVAPETSA
jgi:hypothetical protein